ncbi:ABC transporter substrate-binding protein [Desulfovibrio sp. OttesenSCG-928-I05]|nr:ABC transporter substrate-binding protein [Desulfovibrio sp. OttesenSCG-928-I05]
MRNSVKKVICGILLVVVGLTGLGLLYYERHRPLAFILMDDISESGSAHSMAQYAGVLLAFEDAGDGPGTLLPVSPDKNVSSIRQWEMILQGKKRVVSLIAVRHHDALEEIERLAEEALTEYKPVALIGAYTSSQASVMGAVAARHGVPLLSPMASSPYFSVENPFSFSMVPTTDMQAEALAYFAVRELRAKRLAVLYDATNRIYAQDIAQKTARRFTGFGGASTFLAPYEGRGNYADAARAIIAYEPDFVVLPDFSQDVLEQISLLRSDYSGPVAGGDTWAVESTGSIWDTVGNGYWLTPWHIPAIGHAAQAFAMRYRERFEKWPTPTAAIAYDGVMRFLSALRQADGTSSIALQESLAALQDMDGVAGKYFFSEGNTLKDLWVIKLQTGTSDLLGTLKPGIGLVLPGGGDVAPELFDNPAE